MFNWIKRLFKREQVVTFGLRKDQIYEIAERCSSKYSSVIDKDEFYKELGLRE